MENNIRLGKISAIDYAAGTVRVVYHEKDDAVTAPIPLISSEYFMPEVDDMVMVLHLSNGTKAGVVLRRAWSEKNKHILCASLITRTLYPEVTGSICLVP